MTRFILIDPWLRNVGGHNYQYALDMLEAADRLARESILAVSRELEETPDDAQHQVLRVFRYEPASRYWLGPDGKLQWPLDIHGDYLDHARPTQSLLETIRRRLRNGLDARGNDRRRRVREYAEDCSRLFQQVGVRGDDIVFLPSLSEFDFLGLVQFLESAPDSRSVVWHLQFHFDIFEGRQHEYAAQVDRLRRFRRQFAAALERLPHHRLRFYCTTESIAEQYNRMHVATFRPLPYPVSQSIQPPRDREQPAPIRLTCAGTVRREKGCVALAKIAQEVVRGRLSNRNIQLVIQANSKSIRRVLPMDLVKRFPILAAPDPKCEWPIAPVPFPLPATEYGQLIRQADIGLFLYDARRYHARCSGVLSEMLAAGTPVIVPEGCWLADQLTPSHAGHVDRLFDHESTPMAGDDFTRKGDDVTLKVDAEAGAVAIRAHWTAESSASRYLEISMLQAGRVQETRVVSAPGYGHHASLVMRLAPGSGEVRLRARSGYEGAPVDRITWEVKILSSPFGEAAALRTPLATPLGAVGLAAQDTDDFVRRIDEMIDHYSHYRRTAIQFAGQWRHDHAALRTLELLSANSRVESPLAPSRVA